ncbi:MAG: hypothetical protein II370_01200, partial [Clostridia bacterium]|nr:hypothetical protein [Clostridia bacterium]
TYINIFAQNSGKMFNNFVIATANILRFVRPVILEGALVCAFADVSLRSNMTAKAQMRPKDPGEFA